MPIPSDAVLHTAEVLALRHPAPSMYRRVTRLYTAYLRGIDRMPRNCVVDKQYLVNELDRGRMTALAINCNQHLRLVGLATGALIEYSEALLVCTDLELVSGKWHNDRQVAPTRRGLLRQACLRYATHHHLLNNLSVPCRTRRKLLWRSPCGTDITSYRLQGTRLLRG